MLDRYKRQARLQEDREAADRFLGLTQSITRYAADLYGTIPPDKLVHLEYYNMEKVRMSKFDCVERTLTAEEIPVPEGYEVESQQTDVRSRRIFIGWEHVTKLASLFGEKSGVLVVIQDKIGSDSIDSFQEMFYLIEGTVWYQFGEEQRKLDPHESEDFALLDDVRASLFNAHLFKNEPTMADRFGLSDE